MDEQNPKQPRKNSLLSQFFKLHKDKPEEVVESSIVNEWPEDGHDLWMVTAQQLRKSPQPTSTPEPRSELRISPKPLKTSRSSAH